MIVISIFVQDCGFWLYIITLSITQKLIGNGRDSYRLLPYLDKTKHTKQIQPGVLLINCILVNFRGKGIDVDFFPPYINMHFFGN